MRIVFLLMPIFLFSCGSYFEKKDQKTTPVQPPSSSNKLDEESISFEEIKTKILELNNCIKCHQNYVFYESVKQDIDKIVQTIETNRMPKNEPTLNSQPLTDGQKKLLSSWVSMGAPEKPVASEKPVVPAPPDKVPDKLEPTWNSLSKKIFFERCTSCHNPNGEAKFLDLSSRQIIFKQRDKKFGDVTLLNFENPDLSYMLEVIQDPVEPMPPKNSKFSQLNKEEIETLKQWIALGLP